VRIPQNVAFGYDLGKISAGCLVNVHLYSQEMQRYRSVHARLQVIASVCIGYGLY